MAQRVHGVIKPNRRGNVPARVVNVQSKKKNENNKIRLDKLTSDNPVICVKRRLGGIGDVIMTTPLLKEIKRLIPDCHLIYATDLEYADGALGDIIRHNPYVDELIPNSQIAESTYAYSVDVTATGLAKEKAGQIPPNRIDMFAEAVGVCVGADPVPVYEVTDEEREMATKRIEADFLGPAKSREDIKLIVIQVRSNDARRTWPLDHMDKLADMLAKDPSIRVLLCDWGDKADRWESRERVWAIKNESIVDIAAIIEQSDLVICPDSSILHLAGALSKKIVAIFGPIPPESRINHYTNAHAVTLGLSCQYCWYTPMCIRSNNTKFDCLTKLTPKMVHDVAIKKMANEYIVETKVEYGKNMTTVGGQDPVILVKRTTGGIGDLVMATAGIEALKEKFPNKKLHVAVNKNLHPVLENNPYIDHVLDINQPINAKIYHMIFDISHPCARYEVARLRARKPVEKNRVEIYAEALGSREIIKDLKPRIHFTEEELKEGKKFLLENGLNPNKKTIAIATNSTELYRDWPEENYTVLFEALKDKFNIAIFHKERKNFYPGIIDARGLPLRKAISTMATCDGLITVDTGYLHIAAALNIPTVALFGPIDYKARCKGYKNTTVIVSNLDCIPCWRNGTTKCKHTGLVKSYSRCMENIHVKQVIKVALTKFKGI